MSTQEINKIRPEFFFGEVSKELNIDRDIIGKVYSKYTAELLKAIDLHPVINVYGLGRFETNHKKSIRLLNLLIVPEFKLLYLDSGAMIILLPIGRELMVC